VATGAIPQGGHRVQPAEKTKSDLYAELLPALNSGKVELLDHKRLLAQLLGLERRTSRSGKDSIDHGPHGSDDLANAAAGALGLVLAFGSYPLFPVEEGDEEDEEAYRGRGWARRWDGSSGGRGSKGGRGWMRPWDR
jgi:hypothetical protein